MKEGPVFSLPCDHGAMMAYVEALCQRYKDVDFRYLTHSIMGRGIPLLSLGQGDRTVLYVGAHHGMEWLTTVVLLRFVQEYCEARERHATMFGISMDYIHSTRRILIVPMLNPDGVDYAIHGVGEDHVLYERLLRMNGGSNDFSFWQANARGVDLNHNYDAGFTAYKLVERERGIEGGAPTGYSGEHPESEPEVSALCRFLRFHESIRMVLTLHTQGEEIYYTGVGEELPDSLRVGRVLARLSGYRLARPTGGSAYGGLTDWCITALRRPSFTVECGKGKNPLPSGEAFGIYSRLREMLFTAPTLL